MTSQFVDMMSWSNFYKVVLFPLSSLVTGLSFMSMSSLVLQLWQLTFIKDWSEIWNSQVHPLEFCPIFGDWGKFGIPNLTRVSLMKYYWMLQNTKVKAFTVSGLLRENKTNRGVGVKLPPPLMLGLRKIMNKRDCWEAFPTNGTCLFTH